MADYETKKYDPEDQNGQPEPLANYELHQDPRSDDTDASSSKFELEQEQGVSRIEALCEFEGHDNVNHETFADQSARRSSSDTVFGYGWKLWALYM